MVEVYCKKYKHSYRLKRRIFDTLLDYSNGNKERCRKHGCECELIFEFPFGLDVKHNRSTLLECFAPKQPQKWHTKQGDKVIFYPFLVIFKRHSRNRAIWLPYWHVVKSKKGVKYKYGQWAPYMDIKLFKDLYRQAAKKGYFK